jgi:hypothetical protein
MIVVCANRQERIGAAAVGVSEPVWALDCWTEVETKWSKHRIIETTKGYAQLSKS